MNGTCSKCGLVHQDAMEHDMEGTWFLPSPKGGFFTSQVEPWRSLSKIDGRMPYRASREKDTRRKLSAAGFPAFIVEGACVEYEKIARKRLVVGSRAIDYLAACVLKVTRDHGAPFLISDVIDALDADWHRTLRAIQRCGFKLKRFNMKAYFVKMVGVGGDVDKVLDGARLVEDVKKKFPAMTPNMACAVAASMAGMKDVPLLFVSAGSLDRVLSKIFPEKDEEGHHEDDDDDGFNQAVSPSPTSQRPP